MTSKLASVHVAVSSPAFGNGQRTVPRVVRAQDCLTFPRFKLLVQEPFSRARVEEPLGRRGVG
jgi:hypothetical protein